MADIKKIIKDLQAGFGTSVGYIKESTDTGARLKRGQTLLDESGKEWITEGTEVVRGGGFKRSSI